MTTPPDPWPAVAERLEGAALMATLHRMAAGSSEGLVAPIMDTAQAAISELTVLRARAEAAERRVGVLSEALGKAHGIHTHDGTVTLDFIEGEDASAAFMEIEDLLDASGSADRGGEG